MVCDVNVPVCLLQAHKLFCRVFNHTDKLYKGESLLLSVRSHATIISLEGADIVVGNQRISIRLFDFE